MATTPVQLDVLVGTDVVGRPGPRAPGGAPVLSAQLIPAPRRPGAAQHRSAAPTVPPVRALAAHVTHAAEGADWATRAACRDLDPDELFVQGAAQNKVKARCVACTVRTECLADALDNRVEFGVWGGMTERERRSVLRRRPEVVSWKALLFTARTRALGSACTERSPG